MSIYEDLKSGKTAEELAAAFTDELNKAQAALKKEQEELARVRENEERAKRLAQKLEEKKRESMRDLVDRFLAHINTFYPNAAIERTDALVNTVADLTTLTLDTELKSTKRLEVKLELDDKKPKKIGDPFAAFFAKHGL